MMISGDDYVFNCKFPRESFEKMLRKLWPGMVIVTEKEKFIDFYRNKRSVIDWDLHGRSGVNGQNLVSIILADDDTFTMVGDKGDILDSCKEHCLEVEARTIKRLTKTMVYNHKDQDRNWFVVEYNTKTGFFFMVGGFRWQINHSSESSRAQVESSGTDLEEGIKRYNDLITGKIKPKISIS